MSQEGRITIDARLVHLFEKLAASQACASEHFYP